MILRTVILIVIFFISQICLASTYRMIVIEKEGIDVVKKIDKRFDSTIAHEGCEFDWSGIDKGILSFPSCSGKKISIALEKNVVVKVDLNTVDRQEILFEGKEFGRQMMNGKTFLVRTDLIDSKLASQWFERGINSLEFDVNIDLLTNGNDIILMNSKFKKSMMMDQGAVKSLDLEIALFKEEER